MSARRWRGDGWMRDGAARRSTVAEAAWACAGGAWSGRGEGIGRECGRPSVSNLARMIETRLAQLGI
jgi:hypothetical protein